VVAYGPEDQFVFGFCLSSTSNPTVNNSVYQDTGFQFTGPFSHIVSNLNANTTYYARAYMFNSQKTVYGRQVTFSTLGGGCQGETQKFWIDNTYQLVEIGNQCWFKENLRLENYAFTNGYTLDLVVGQCNWVNTTTPAYSQMDDTSTQVATFGNLYNFYAVETGELCPSG